MSLNLGIVIAVLILSFFAWKIYLNYKDSKEYVKVILNLPAQGDGWIELVNPGLQAMMLGKVLSSFDGYVIGVGVLVKEHFPAMLGSDIDVKIAPQLLDGLSPICRFIIDSQGKEVILTELKDMQFKEKLKPYVDDYSKIKLLMGLDSNEYLLIDTIEGRSGFERIWEATVAKKKLL
ncbi:MAG: hypothetical protein H0U49_02910 [Parachlamydiaceae bacterium]|nr:hypothetical protein [Parachlamydiaceae bacterium]